MAKALTIKPSGNGNNVEELVILLLNSFSTREAQRNSLQQVLCDPSSEQGKTEWLLKLLHQFFENDVLFRTFLREEIYPRLKEGFWKNPPLEEPTRRPSQRLPIIGAVLPQKVHVPGMMDTRIIILKMMLREWKLNQRGEGEARETILGEEAEECFKFICEIFTSYDYEAPQSKDLLLAISSEEVFKAIRNTPTPMDPNRIHGHDLREAIINMVKEYRPNQVFKTPEFFDIWFERDYLPEELKKVLLHARIDLVGAGETLEALQLAK